MINRCPWWRGPLPLSPLFTTIFLFNNTAPCDASSQSHWEEYDEEFCFASHRTLRDLIADPPTTFCKFIFFPRPRTLGCHISSRNQCQWEEFTNIFRDERKERSWLFLLFFFFFFFLALNFWADTLFLFWGADIGFFFEFSLLKVVKQARQLPYKFFFLSIQFVSLLHFF